MPKSKLIRIVNGRVIQGGRMEEETLWIQDGKFIDPERTFWEQRIVPDVVIDAQGMLVSPGYIDIQVNGAVGVDFTADRENIVEGLDLVSKALLRYGCTSYCPTLVSSFPSVYKELLPKLKKRQGSVRDGAEILGVHLEGPFISPAKFGAHQLETLSVSPNGISDFESCYGFKLGSASTENIAFITVAPEMSGVMEVIPQLVEAGIRVSIGHSGATTSEAERAIANGASMVTHLFNAMQQFHHRDPGIIGILGSAEYNPYFGIICDGIHCHPNSVKIAHTAHPDGAILVTDAMSAMGLSPGEYHIGNMKVDKSEDRVYIQGTTILAGSVITIDACVRNFKSFTGCSIAEAVEAATLHPAQALGIAHKKGTFRNGADADFIFLDDDLRVRRVFVAGEEVRM
ncbi:putative N-acetylglucosamine-6-phosphate deacetylase [Basidiobolus meristosporus CBS 931.73]|uniref:N-acetylglucosamine-6-phosphate deacetylase n=1 Tax=Basidiobolus meristosporus CBS 931.73 TaxID=1314790 RepID=A0A1Y1Z3W0_9FUNG|nr:putative N-acetylglucosamine-6-phosphate deacetylase [Basidiobolus meristosporus CBS 931.73]|eukprot:ORY04794.1 putative N-acetylglucosamine-6-phosphate deacetylase [Basidiobolus meristosporus CBS 931.73]